MTLRNALRRISYDLGLRGQYTHDDVIRELRVKHRDLVNENSEKLENVALKRLLSDVEAKQSRSYNHLQSELFPELAGFPASYDAKAMGLSDKRGSRVLLQSLSVKAVRFIANMTKPTRKNSSPADKMKELLGELAPYILSDDEMFSDVIRRSRGE
jgi:hypothetical protein